MSNARVSRRDIVIIVLFLASAWFVYSRPVQKVAAGEKIDLAAIVPSRLAAWGSETYDTAAYRDKWQSINELLVRRYFKMNPFALRGPGYTSLAFITEYTTDLRQNFSFHFPENCHRAGGNEIEILPPLEVVMDDGRVVRAKSIYIKGKAGSIETTDKVVSYWIVIGGKAYWKTFYVKLDQMLSGLLSQAKIGFLVRVDYDQDFQYSTEGLQQARETTAAFLKDLYETLDAEKRDLLFGRLTT